MNLQGLPPEVFWAAVCIGGGIGLVIGLTIQIFFLLTLTRTQKEVAERNQLIAPGTIWLTIVLNFIPVVGAIWAITLVTRLSGSLRKEFEQRGWKTEPEGFGKTAGLIWACGSLIYMPINMVQLYLQFNGDIRTATLISFLSLPLAMGIFVCFILFWVQMSQYGRRLRGRSALEDELRR